MKVGYLSEGTSDGPPLTEPNARSSSRPPQTCSTNAAPPPWSHIKLSAVVKQASLTTGAAYRLWDDQAAFHQELAAAAVRWCDDKNPYVGLMQRLLPPLADNAPRYLLRSS